MAVPELHYRNLSGQLVAYHDPDKLNISGGTLTGPLTVQGALTSTGLLTAVGADVSNGRIIRVGTPAAGTDAVNRDYVDTSAGGKRIVSVISTSQTAAAAAKTDYIYICSAALTLTMPTAVGNANVYTVKRSGTGNVTIATTSSQTIDGVTSLVMTTQWTSVELVSDGTNWVLINPNEVEIGSVQPTSPAVDVWVDPTGTWADEYTTKAYTDGPGWIAPTLQNSWVNYGAPYDPCGYTKVGRAVYLRGLLKNGTIGGTMFTLPAGYRPGAQLIIAVVTNSNTIGRMDVAANGGVIANAGSNGWFSVAVSFLADA